MSFENTIDTVVLDAGPILQNAPPASSILSKSKNVFTSPAIIAEIKDANARRRFETTLLPFVTIKTPSLLSVKFVTDFARKTGDLAVLSKPDVEILALTYELEQARKDREDESKRLPIQNDVSTMADSPVTGFGPPQTPSAFVPKPDSVEISKHTPTAPWAISKITPPEAKSYCSVEHDEKEGVAGDVSASLKATGDETQDSIGSLSIEDTTLQNDFIPTLSAANSPESIIPTTEPQDCDSEDSDGWITPANIKRIQAAENDKSSSKFASKSPLRVAIITTDFAMQNVILQMGLNLLSTNLNRISNIRTYVLRCHACFQTVKDTSKQFCPRCGQPTLTRVSCSTNAKGEFKIHLKKNMQWNHRGDRYSIPKPVPGQSNGKVGKGKGGGKGGWGQDLILAEDQKEYQKAMDSTRRSKGTDLMDEDYLPGILTGNRGRPGGRPKIGAGRNVNSKKRV